MRPIPVGAKGTYSLKVMPAHLANQFKDVSLPKVAEHVSRNYEGMMVGLPAVEWLRFRELSARELAGCLRHWAMKVCLEKVRKAKSRPRKNGGPKPVHDPSTPHVSTARLLAARRQQQ